jgi:hypothetical protein
LSFDNKSKAPTDTSISLLLNEVWFCYLLLGFCLKRLEIWPRLDPPPP